WGGEVSLEWNSRLSAFSSGCSGKKNSNLPLALAFKIDIDKFDNQLTFLRVYSGKISANSYVYNVNQQKKERTEEIKQVGVGDIAAAYGLRQTVTENIEFDEPVISRAVEAKTNKDNDKLSEVLKKLIVQDPGLKYQIDKKT
ncbi:8611_t:CDS:2, partial [Cetraspora pellucida]